MDTEDEVAMGERNDIATMQSEGPLQDAPEIQAVETSVTDSPESPNEEVSLPPLIQDDKSDHEREIFPSEIPDSDAFSGFSSPEKAQAFRVDTQTHHAEIALLLTAPELAAPQDVHQPEDKEMGIGSTEQGARGSEAIEQLSVDVTSEAVILPPSLEVDDVRTSAAITQDIGSIIEPEIPTSDDMTVAELLFTAPKEEQAVEQSPQDSALEESKEENEALNSSLDIGVETSKADTEGLQPTVQDHTSILIAETAVSTSNKALQEPELSITPIDGKDVVMGDDIPILNEPPVHLDSSSAMEGIAEKGKEEQELHAHNNLVQPRSIADSDDEEFSDGPIPETVPEAKPKVSKRVRGKAKAAEKPTEKVAKKRGRPKKVAVPDIQQPEQSKQPDEIAETIDAPTEPMDLEEELPMPQQDAKAAFSEPSWANSTGVGSHNENNTSSGPSVVPVGGSKENSTPISSSPVQKSAIHTPVKVRISPNPSFKMPTPVKKSQAQSSSTMILSSPSRESSSAAVATSQEGDNGASATTAGSPGLQNQTKDFVLAELKAMKMASIQARIATLQAEIAAKQEKRDELQKDLKQPAADTVKRHIKLLHDYNDIKDIGQGLVGMIADQRGLRIAELYEEFGVDIKD